MLDSLKKALQCNHLASNIMWTQQYADLKGRGVMQPIGIRAEDDTRYQSWTQQHSGKPWRQLAGSGGTGRTHAPR